MSTSGQLNIKQLPKIDHKFCVVFEIRSLVIIKVIMDYFVKILQCFSILFMSYRNFIRGGQRGTFLRI